MNMLRWLSAYSARPTPKQFLYGGLVFLVLMLVLVVIYNDFLSGILPMPANEGVTR